MIKRLKSKRIVLPDSIFDGYVYFENGKITAVTDAELYFDSQEDFGDKYIAPGFTDIHVHGGVGADFGKCNARQAAEAVNYHLSHGTTTIFPTLTASKHEDTLAALKCIKECIQSGLTKAEIAGVHLEGPYFSQAQCGAQNPQYITAPIKEDYEYILKEYGDIIKRWSYAPERDANGEFCKAVTSVGVIASAGHTDAEFCDMERAFENGCSLITHLYSCTSTVTRKNGYRHAGVIEYAYFNDKLAVEIIADGAHLPPELIRLIYKIKGRDSIALVTDALSVCGMDTKSGSLNGIPYIVEDGVCKLCDRSAFAGSIATSDRLVRTCVKDAGISVTDSVYMASTVPARLFSLNKGMLCNGYDADIVIFNDDIHISGVFIKGEKVSC